MIRHIRNNLKEKKGSALVSVFMVIMVMLVLGMGILALTMNNVKQSAVVDNYERDYYAADRAVQLGIENLKRTVRDYYNDLALKFADTANIAAYNTAYGNFFANVRSNAAGSFIEPALDTSRGGPTSTVTTVTMGTPVGDTCVYTITSTAAAGETTRTVSQSITIIRTENYKTEFVTKFGNNALIAGNDLDLSVSKNSKIHVSGDATIGGEVTESKNKSFEAGNYVDGDPTSCTDLTIESKLTWYLTYDKFTQSKDTTVLPNVVGASANVADAAYNIGGKLLVEGNPGASYTVTGTSPSSVGQIGCTGNLTISNCSLKDITIYVTGNVTINNSTLAGVTIFCDGSLTYNDGVLKKDSSGRPCQLIVQNNTTLVGDSLNSQGSKIFLYTGGTLNIDIEARDNTIDNIIAYAGTEIKILLGSNGAKNGNKTNISGLLYSAGTAVINSCYITGQLVVKGSIYTDASINSTTLSDLVFAPSDISDLLNDPFFTSSIFANSTLGSTTKIYIKPLVNEMYTGQTNIIES